MNNGIASALLWLGILGSGLIAGVFFAFSTFIMGALARIEAGQAIAAMRSINKVILGSLFMPVFFGTAIVGLVLIPVALFQLHGTSLFAALAAAVLYVVGVIATTMVFNVPLNNTLAAASGDAESAAIWSEYLVVWVRWNHVRTIASLAACGLFVLALA